MRLSPRAIANLQAHFLDEFGVKLSDEEAQQIGLKVVRFVYAKELKKRKLVPKPAEAV
jgi:hypothetical protein